MRSLAGILTIIAATLMGCSGPDGPPAPPAPDPVQARPAPAPDPAPAQPEASEPAAPTTTANRDRTSAPNTSSQCAPIPRRPDGLVTRDAARCIAVANGHSEPRVSGPRVVAEHEDEVPALVGHQVYVVRSIQGLTTRESVDFIDATSAAFVEGYVGPSQAAASVAEQSGEATPERADDSE